MKGFLPFWSALLVLMLAFGACTDSGAEQLCEPGTIVFCRCRGFVAGDKQCNAAGDGFSACQVAGQTCDEIVEPGAQGATSVSVSSTGSGPPPKAGELYAPCSGPSDCGASLQCARGYCTKSCETFEDCAEGDCVMKDGKALCSPYCLQQSDCLAHGEETVCGFTNDALPPYDVVVCADWDPVSLPPDGYPPSGNCDVDARCHLGLPGVERVCSLSGCTDGCRADFDCPGTEAVCSSDGESIGACKLPETDNLDDCPGFGVTLDLGANSSKNLQGDTSTLTAPAELQGVTADMCFFSATPSEEAVYRVTAAEAGTLLILLTPSSTFDSQLYGRGTDCLTGEQLFCVDDIGAGKSEIHERAVKAGETIWIVVDGWSGSTGAYTLELLLTKR